MKSIRIIGVPEHFNFPFRLLFQENKLVDKGLEIKWIEESRGSGQMIQALNSGEADLAILLTESFFKEAETNPNLKMIGFHVESPLVWGVHVGSKQPFKEIKNVPDPHFLISRKGSGSQLMANVLIKESNFSWDKPATFEEVGNMDGAAKAMELGNSGMFLWEKYTTSPMVKAGIMNRIGEVKSPWPCFVMVTTERAITDFEQELLLVRDEIYSISKQLISDPHLAGLISQSYHLDPKETIEWLSQTKWAISPAISKSELEKIVSNLQEFGIISKLLNAEDHFVTGSIIIN